MLGAGCWVLGAGCGCWVPSAGCWVPGCLGATGLRAAISAAPSTEHAARSTALAPSTQHEARTEHAARTLSTDEYLFTLANGRATIASPSTGAVPLHTEASGTAPPDAFGPFHVLDQVGAGALGPVFRASDFDRGRLVAVKVFQLDLAPERMHCSSPSSKPWLRPGWRIRPSRRRSRPVPTASWSTSFKSTVRAD